MARVLIPPSLRARAGTFDPTVRVECIDGQTMGTSWSVKLVRPAQLPLHTLRDAIQQSLDQVVSEMSHWEPDSQLSRFNRAVPGEWRDLPPGFFTVLSYALDIARMTDGAYDPTIGPLVDLWGFGPTPARISPPSADEIALAKKRVGWSRPVLDRSARRVRQPGGCRLDFSAIAKGYGVDRAVSAVRRLGVQDFLVEVGGELHGEGTKPDGTPWWVELERPQPFCGENILVALHGMSVATSGDYRRFFEAEGRLYSHSIDPRTGWPIDNGVVSVSVLHQSCMAADAHATAITILGEEAGHAFAERHGLAVLIVTRDGTEIFTSALAAMLE